MTKTYSVRWRGFEIGCGGIAGTALAVAFGTMLWKGFGAPWPFGLALGLLIWLPLMRSVGRQVYEIRVSEDGTVTFVRLWERFWPSGQLAAHEIRAIEGKWDRDADGDPFWAFAIEYVGGQTPAVSFGDGEAFIAHLRALNPAIELRGVGPRPGTWP